MRKIFTRYVLSLVLAGLTSLPIAADEVIIDEPFTKSDFSGVIFGQVNSLSNGWTVYGCNYNYGSYVEALCYGKPTGNYGYVTTKSFGYLIEGHSAKMSFACANTAMNKPSRVLITIQGGGTFDDETREKYIDIKASDRDYHTYFAIFWMPRRILQ